MKTSQFDALKKLAREKRLLYNVNTSAFGLREVRAIYKAEQIIIDYYPLPNKIKAIYMCEDGHYSVAVQKKLPEEPKIFALLHELKHHYCDQDLLRKGHIHCGDFNMRDPIEIGAEIFAAEFIYPMEEFAKDISKFNLARWKTIDVVRFKRSCKAKVSYRYICRRLNELGLMDFSDFDKVQFQKMEYELYGLPYHLRKKKFSKQSR